MKRWTIVIFRFDEEPETHSFYNEMLAEAVYKAIQITDEILAVELYEKDTMIGRRTK